MVQSFLTHWEPAKKKVTTQRKLSRLSLATVCRSQCLLHTFWRGCWISPRLSLELSRNEMTSSRALGIQLFTLNDQMVENFLGRWSLNWTLEMNHYTARLHYTKDIGCGVILGTPSSWSENKKLKLGDNIHFYEKKDTVTKQGIFNKITSLYLDIINLNIWTRKQKTNKKLLYYSIA